MRIGILGDVHAEHFNLERALEHFRKEHVDEIVCVGDIVDGIGDVDRCISLLVSNKVLTVRGNHDRWMLEGEMRGLADATMADQLSEESLDFLRSLPEQIEVPGLDKPLLLCHGVGRNDMSKINEDDFGYALEVNEDLQRILSEGRIRIIANGHSHHRMVNKIGRLTIIGAGTLKAEHDPCFSLYDSRKNKVRFFELDSD